ncbi:glycosyltransferase [Phenylobacterium deserti]|uniref:Glycosyltransferase family 2 protein n=1 Tax=Phenylobacterium deserti TaxID=1914756 RepID=A0A328ACT9_9CAUL|nr:glycosyltransferase [Phenylobacterium deserti]RAK52633.1 glycosyltransferase family 2 protein [Phenylobacterium deserti]
MKAPIALFAYRRADHLSRTLDALEACEGFADHDLHIYSDGPKNAAAVADVEAVRELLGFRKRPNMTVVAQEANRGLANSIISAVTALTDQYGSVIVVEDDLLLQPSALLWFQGALEKYSSSEQVMHVGGYQYSVPEFESQRSGSFQRFTTSWGWATWKRAWKHFDAQATGWEELDSDPLLERSFNAGGTFPFADMLRKQMRGGLDSWAIRWWWSVFKADGLAVMPPKSLVTNIGFDSSATHNSVGSAKALLSGPRPAVWDKPGPPDLPGAVELVPFAEQAFRRGLLRTNAMRNHKIKKGLAALGMRRFQT